MRVGWIRAALVGLAVIAAAGCRTAPATVGAVSTFGELATTAERFWDARIDDDDPGLSAIFFSPSTGEQFVTAGSTGGRLSRPIDNNTVFQVASISKTVAAYGVLALVDRGAASLDTAVESYLSRYSFPQSRWDSSGVTVGRLLSHTAGLSVTGYPGFAPERALPSIEDSLAGETGRFYGVYSPGRVRIRRRPGEEWRYSGGGYTVLQLMVEELSGGSFAGALDEEVLGPLNMADSSFDVAVVNQDSLAVGHGRRGQERPKYRFTAQAAAGLYSTASDLAKLLEDLGRGASGEPALLSAVRYEEMTTEYASVETGVAMGLGFHLRSMPDGTRVAFHYGANQGWQSYYGINLDSREGMVILSNSDRAISEWINPVVAVYEEMVMSRVD